MNKPKHTAKLNIQNHFSTLALRATALGDVSIPEGYPDGEYW